MMDQNIVRGSEVVTFVKQGDTITANLVCPKGLTQYVIPGSDVINPNWEVAANQPQIYPHVTTTLTQTIISAFTDTRWYYDGVLLVFTNNVTADGRFKLETYTINGQSLPCLRIMKNLMLASVLSKEIMFKASIETGGVKSAISCPITARRVETSGNAYVGQIAATNGGVINDTTPNSTLSAALLHGGVPYTGSDVTYKWFKLDPNDIDSVKDGWQDLSKTTKDILVGLALVDTQDNFRCDFFVASSFVTSAFQQVIDQSDMYVMNLNPRPLAAELSYYQPERIYSPRVHRRSKETPETGWAMTYQFVKPDGTFLKTGSCAEGASFKLLYADALAVGGCDIRTQVTATKA